MSGCWIFEGAKSRGYGHASVNGRFVKVHRAAYEVLVGPIPEGLQLDHLCRNRACYNPAHLEPVTQQENIRRGPQAQKTECVNGHALNAANTYYRKDRPGRRQCRVCINAAKRRKRAASC